MSTIDEIMGAIGRHGDDCIRDADAASASFEALREMIAAALADVVERITVWQAHGDGGDRCRGPVIAYCGSRAQAAHAAKGRGWYGGNGEVTSRPALRIAGKVWLLHAPDPIEVDALDADRDADLRARTIAALSAEQRRVLGLTAAEIKGKE
ncbi:MAG: hypothetical protein RJA63_14 [Pseudomonadota bacterium]|jgi:hypothetical protein